MIKENLIGETVAGYHIQRFIGEGGTSTVYQAKHTQHGTVAVKFLREKLRSDKTAIVRFVREARYGTRVEHPNVVRTLEIGEAGNGRHFLATEWAEGELLERYAKRVGAIPPADVADIVAQIADAVEAAHAAGIVHRDLKPENVMYDPKTRIVKLLDFGIAMDTDPQADERLTRAGFFVGTLMYVAPEALSGELVSPQADQYSLATIAYYLLTATLPYVAKTPREMFTQLLSQPPIPINSARKDLSFGESVEKVMSTALSRNPSERFPNATVFARELRAALTAPTPTRSSVPEPEPPPAKWKSLFRFGR